VGMMLAIPAYTILRVIIKEILYVNKTASDAKYMEKDNKEIEEQGKIEEKLEEDLIENEGL
jgi:hypothetical protein